MKIATPLALAVTAALLSLAFLPSGAAGSDRVIFISADGMRPDAVDALGEEGAPTFHRLRREGAWTNNARTDAVYTITLPNHTSMITSRGAVGKTGHNWIKNTDPKLGENLHRNRKAYLSSFFGVAHDHGLRTALYASKSKFTLYDISYDERTGAADKTGEDNGRDKIDQFVINADPAMLVDQLLAELDASPADATMLHLRNADSAGHKETWNLSPGSPYLASITEVDRLLGKLIAHIENSPALNGKTWVILTADHGGLTSTKGHGEGKERDNYTIPFYVWGPGVPAAADLYQLNAKIRKDPGAENPADDNGETAPPIRNGDVGNLILSLLKLPAIPDSTINAAQDLVVTEATGTTQ